MANIRKITGKTGKVSFRIDYRDPDGKRVMKRFKLQKDAKAYLAKVQTAINENEYEQIFGTKKKSTITFNEITSTKNLTELSRAMWSRYSGITSALSG